MFRSHLLRTAQSLPRRRPVLCKPLVIAAAGAALGASCFLVATVSSRPLLASSAPPPEAIDLDDPLSALAPSILNKSTSHLSKLGSLDLVRRYFVYLGSSHSILVEAAPSILNKLEWARDNIPVLGSGAWAVFVISMRSTFYRVFVGGATVPECVGLVNDYAQNGVGCLLVYSAEAAVDGSAIATGVNEAHIREACNALRAASKFGPPPSATQSDVPPNRIKPTLLAIKMSGLVYEPALLARATSALIGSSSYQRGTRLPSSTLFPASPDLSEEDHEALQKLYVGLRGICAEGREGGVRVLVDAEQSWYQPAIDRFVDLLSEEFNKLPPGSTSSNAAIPIVHNTYQAYLRTTPPKLAAALAHADSHNYSFGAKLVRGAYVESERDRASLSKTECAVWPSKSETDDCYDACALLLERRIAKEVKRGEKLGGGTGTGLCLASHNGTSARKVLEALREEGLARNTKEGLWVDERVRGRISFAQLMGMSDNLTDTLVQLVAPSETGTTSDAPHAVPFVVKYVPYASVDQALPYLIRRANENQSILQADSSGRGGASAERRAVGREIRRRFGLAW